MTVSDIEAVDRRTRDAERQMAAAVFVWLLTVRGAVTVTMVREALRTGVSARLIAAVQAVAAPDLAIDELAEEEAGAALRLVVDNTRPPRLVELRFDIRDPAFEIAVFEHRARLVREIDQLTRDAISRVVAEAYRRGLHPYDFAPQVRELVGLTSRQATAVLNLADALTADGMAPSRVADVSIRYAQRLRRHRAQTIARTETMRAANTGRIAGFRQAGRAGLFDTELARLVWDATLDDRVCVICEGLEGETAELEGGLFAGGYDAPPAHPRCRCVVQLDF